MRTSLAYINEAAAYATREDLPVPMTTERVAGFRLPAIDKSEIGARKRYAHHRRELERRLEEIGVTPLAILPHDWWRRMASESGLVSLHASGNISLPIFDLASRIGLTVLAVPALTLGATTALLTGTALSLLGFDSVTALAPAAMAAAAMTFGSPFSDRLRSLMVRASVGVYVWALGGETGLLRKLLGMRDIQRSSEFEYEILPQPPAETVEILERLRPFMSGYVGSPVLEVVCAPEALRVHPNPRVALEIEIGARVRGVREEIRDTLLDPIICVVSGPAVALVAQYGEFPIEKEVVDRVLAQG